MAADVPATDFKHQGSPRSTQVHDLLEELMGLYRKDLSQQKGTKQNQQRGKGSGLKARENQEPTSKTPSGVTQDVLIPSITSCYNTC